MGPAVTRSRLRCAVRARATSGMLLRVSRSERVGNPRCRRPPYCACRRRIAPARSRRGARMPRHALASPRPARRAPAGQAPAVAPSSDVCRMTDCCRRRCVALRHSLGTEDSDALRHLKKKRSLFVVSGCYLKIIERAVSKELILGTSSETYTIGPHSCTRYGSLTMQL